MVRYCRPYNEDWKPDFLIGHDGQDSYTRIFHSLAALSNLTTLRLMGPLVISPNIFVGCPSFPALVDFQLDFATETSDGRWFFLRDNELARKISEEKEDGEDSDDESEEEIMHKWYDTDDSEMNSDDEEGPWRQNDTDTNYD